jgi:hypothetical protein
MRDCHEQSRYQRPGRRKYLVGSGPYQSLDDAKLARSTIRGCPAVEEPPAETPDNEDKSK